MTHPFVLVVGIDFSELSAQAFRVARRLARAHTAAVIHVVSAIPGTADPDVVEDAELTRRGADRLAQFLLAEHAVEGDPGLVRSVQVGPPEEVLRTYAADVHADLLVLGTHGRKGLERLVFGSVAEQLVREAPCSVLVVRDRKLAPEELIEPPPPGGLPASHGRRRVHPSGEAFGLGALDFHIPGI